MVIILGCVHSVGILFSMKHLFSIVSSHLLYHRLPCFTAVVSHIGGRDDLIPSLPFFLRHFVNQCISRFYGTVIKGAA